jgi:NTP pyrophosphatase (non-canonical NTP hydrolase)
VGEAFTAWRKRLPDFGEELADVALYLMAVAEMNALTSTVRSSK